MSLRRVKTLYCIAVIAIGVLLATLGGFVGWLAAVLVMGGALPAWDTVIQVAGDAGANEALGVVQSILNRRRSAEGDAARPVSRD